MSSVLCAFPEIFRRMAMKISSARFKYYLVSLCITMETISLKIDDDSARRLEHMKKKHHYTTKTEFIREAIREKIDRLETKEALLRLEKLYGASKRKTTDAELHRAREKAAQELFRELS